MSPQHCSLAYFEEVELETEVFTVHQKQPEPTLKLMGRSKADITAMEDIVEFGGTLTVSF